MHQQQIEELEQATEVLAEAITAEEHDPSQFTEIQVSLEAEGAEDIGEPLPLTASIGAMLFVSTKPLSAQQLAEYLHEDTEFVEQALIEIQQHFQSDVIGVELKEVAGAWQLRTNARAAKAVQKLIPPKARKLSRAAAETLAIIAYKQPVQRAEIEAIRGVDALPTLKTLLEARLIRIVGREATAGHPALYGTTPAFLEKFGLRDLSELPTVRELATLAAEPGESGEPSESSEDELGAEVESTVAEEQ